MKAKRNCKLFKLHFNIFILEAHLLEDNAF